MKIFNVVLLFLVVLMAGCLKKIDQTIVIGTVDNLMEYSIKKIEAKAGSRIKIILKNNASLDIMKHNIVILSSDKFVNEVGVASIGAPNNLAEHPGILAASAMIGPGEQTELVFQVPTKPGSYPYICTFKGHYVAMQGVIEVK